jgi:hypothetical protein
MALPKIDYPIFSLTIPSTKKEIKFRPFLVKEEKILLMAKTSEQEKDMILAIKQVVNNCAIDKIDVEKLALFDIEFLFLRIRSQSVNNIVSVTYKDNEDDSNYEFDIDLNQVEVVFPEKQEKIIPLSETSGIVMKYPEASLYDDKEFLESGEEVFYQLVLRCIEKIYDEETVYDIRNHSLQEVADYIENLDVKTFEKIREFMVNQPKMTYVINYKNRLGNDRKIELTTLSDFFTLR